MWIASYRAKFGTWVDRAIAAHGRGPYSHSEVVFTSGDCFSSSPRDGGTRFNRIDIHSGHWALIKVPFGAKYEQQVRAFCEDQLGKPYDFAGVLGFIRLGRADPNRWFCSEIVSACLQDAHLISRDFHPSNTSPNSLHKRARYNWG